ncbi:hypothetical protein PPERSA_05661 [Pseudocohnilembus persalinus]|uniref:Uncharacterized protein n=1 Tax=Pseudocohnilembus persalinus TaxID=266149 RepID=A0A0V0QQW3_PSEPJ|nr:hypothetical protein PPERSA_05661 [Pseudocohnilembus persalinus]|eukprot:KRX04400.1 hypothetical protein PPERSA_05661 [Pseudocohnilembus persalinus]
MKKTTIKKPNNLASGQKSSTKNTSLNQIFSIQGTSTGTKIQQTPIQTKNKLSSTANKITNNPTIKKKTTSTKIGNVQKKQVNGKEDKKNIKPQENQISNKKLDNQLEKQEQIKKISQEQQDQSSKKQGERLQNNQDSTQKNNQIEDQQQQEQYLQEKKQDEEQKQQIQEKQDVIEEITIKRNHYTEKFSIKNGELEMSDVDDRFYCSGVYKGNFKMILKEDTTKQNIQKIKEKQLFTGLKGGSIYWLDIIEDEEAENSRPKVTYQANQNQNNIIKSGNSRVNNLTDELKKMSNQELMEKGEKYKQLIEARDLEDCLYN